MAHIDVHQELDLESPVLVEGLPGVGLVGKIATDHLIDTYDMTSYAACYCDGIPDVAVYQDGSYDVNPPVRVYADESRNLLALQSDIPISPQSAPSFSTCLVEWLRELDATPICLSGLPQDKDGVPKLFGIGIGDTQTALETHEIQKPDQGGLVSGPTGAILAEAEQYDHDAFGLIVQANAKFPDPESARVLLVDGIEPLADIQVETDALVEQAEDIASAREELAKRMQQANDESSQAQPLGMYQ